MQDERDSGSDVEEDVNEQHSGSDTGSVDRHSEVLAKQRLWGAFPAHYMTSVLCRSCRDPVTRFRLQTLGKRIVSV